MPRSGTFARQANPGRHSCGDQADCWTGSDWRAATRIAIGPATRRRELLDAAIGSPLLPMASWVGTRRCTVRNGTAPRTGAGRRRGLDPRTCKNLAMTMAYGRPTAIAMNAESKGAGMARSFHLGSGRHGLERPAVFGLPMPVGSSRERGRGIGISDAARLGLRSESAVSSRRLPADLVGRSCGPIWRVKAHAPG